MVLYWVVFNLSFLHIVNFALAVKKDCLLESKEKDELQMRSKCTWVIIGQVTDLDVLLV